MKEIKAFVAAHRVASVLEALRASGGTELTGGRRCRNIIVSNVRRVWTGRDGGDTHYAVDLAEPVVSEAKIELACDDDFVDELLALIANAARTGQAGSGWIVVSGVERTQEVG